MSGAGHWVAAKPREQLKLKFDAARADGSFMTTPENTDAPVPAQIAPPAPEPLPALRSPRPRTTTTTGTSSSVSGGANTSLNGQNG